MGSEAPVKITVIWSRYRINISRLSGIQSSFCSPIRSRDPDKLHTMEEVLCRCTGSGNGRHRFFYPLGSILKVTYFKCFQLFQPSYFQFSVLTKCSKRDAV